MRAPTNTLEVALRRIDAANEEDPNTLEVRGRLAPKELAHAELMSEWVVRLRPDAGEALRLAARAHHVRRWEIPRGSHPPGRAGYLRWRKELQAHHVRVTSDLLRELGLGNDLIERVETILYKRGLGRDPEVQTFEDALCLTFLETQLVTFSAEHSPEKARDVLVKTLRKMSPAALALAGDLELPDSARALVLEAEADARS